MITVGFFSPTGATVACSMWSCHRYAGRLEHSQVHFPFLSFLPICHLLSLPAESSKCDNRGVISSTSRPCSCKVYIYTYMNEKWGLYYNHLVSSVAHLWFMRLTCLRLTGRWITLCACVWFCVCVCRTTWQAPCVTNVRPGSSTYQRPTPRAVCAVSVWASPSSAPAPLGIEIRQVAKLLMVKGGVNIFGIKVWVSVCAAALCQPILSDAVRRGAACKQRSCSGGALTFEPRLASHSDNRLCLSGARRGERAALLPR